MLRYAIVAATLVVISAKRAVLCRDGERQDGDLQVRGGRSEAQGRVACRIFEKMHVGEKRSPRTWARRAAAAEELKADLG